jgi:hypothetical protein
VGSINGPKTGGRRPGTPNKDATLLSEKARELECDPFEILLHFAKGDFKALGYKEYTLKSSPTGEILETLTIEPDLRARCAQKACDFLYPKRKALDITMDDETSKSFGLAYSAESLAAHKAKRDAEKKAN